MIDASQVNLIGVPWFKIAINKNFQNDFIRTLYIVNNVDKYQLTMFLAVLQILGANTFLLKGYLPYKTICHKVDLDV